MYWISRIRIHIQPWKIININNYKINKCSNIYQINYTNKKILVKRNNPSIINKIITKKKRDTHRIDSSMAWRAPKEQVGHVCLLCLLLHNPHLTFVSAFANPSHYEFTNFLVGHVLLISFQLDELPQSSPLANSLCVI